MEDVTGDVGASADVQAEQNAGGDQVSSDNGGGNGGGNGGNTINSLLTSDTADTADSADTASKADSAQSEQADIKLDLPEHYSDEEKAVITDLAKELGLDEKKGESFKKSVNDLNKLAYEKHVKTVNAWADELKTDKDFGGKDFDNNVALAKRGLERFDEDGSLKTLLQESGYGSNPAIVKFFHKIGKTLEDDTVVKGGVANEKKESLAHLMFGQNK